MKRLITQTDRFGQFEMNNDNCIMHNGGNGLKAEAVSQKDRSRINHSTVWSCIFSHANFGRFGFIIFAICTGLLLSVQSPLFAHPSGINLLSQSHRVWGGTAPNEYDLSGVDAIAGSSPLTRSAAGNYSVSAFSMGNDLVNLRGAQAYSSYLFKIEENKLDIELDGYIWYTLPGTSATYKLTDTNTGSILDMFTCSGNEPPSPPDPIGRCTISYENSLTTLDTSHIYELYLSATASDGDGGDAVLNSNLSSVSQVPEPSVMLLGTGGMLITGWLKRRKIIC